MKEREPKRVRPKERTEYEEVYENGKRVFIRPRIKCPSRKVIKGGGKRWVRTSASTSPTLREMDL